MMNQPLAVLCATLLLQVSSTQPSNTMLAQPPAKKTAAAAVKRETPVSWFMRVLKIDPRAYANLTAFRKGRSFDAAPRLASFDRVTGREETIWACGSCWTPTVVDDGIAVLRHSESAAVELWLVPKKGSPRRVGNIDGATMIAGAVRNRVFVGVTSLDCADSQEGPYALVQADMSGRTSKVKDSPCFGTVSLTAAGRLRGDRLLGTTSKTDLTGRQHPRRIIIYTPATGDTPGAVPFDERMTAGVDRFDPVWMSDDRIIYVAGN
ncbi:MAG TPA: hypothetical protein VK504_18685 [Vicinamibacterales bacterium]|nr:hypothetical protein [Vicinamibacterales bacterium]